MVAALTVRVMTSTNAATQSAAQTGISFLSIDSAVTDSGTRSANPVAAGTSSFEKHLRLAIDTAPAVSVGNVKFWTDGTPMSNVALRAKLAVGTGGTTPGTGDSTPTATTMTGDADAYSYVTGSKGTWDAGTWSTVTNVTKAMLLQLQPNSSATAGAWTQETLNYSYDEI